MREGLSGLSGSRAVGQSSGMSGFVVWRIINNQVNKKHDVAVGGGEGVELRESKRGMMSVTHEADE
jgi:hypothetical protein